MSVRASSDPSTVRLRGLSARVQRLALQGQHGLARGDLVEATALLDEAMAEYPAHPELLRLRGLCEHFHGRAASAIELFRKAAAAWPQDGLTASNLGAALATHGELDAALHAFQTATELDPTLIDAWFNLGRALELRHDATSAHAAFSAVLELNPGHRPARIMRAEALKTLGRIDEAVDELRAVLREDPDSVAAWVALVNLKAFRADADDLRGLERLYASAALAPDQRIGVGFAYANFLEAAGQYERAYEVFTAANAAKRATLRWNANSFRVLVDDILAAFAGSDATDAADAHRGSGIAFLVGMPRSGSTLAEQIIAAHPLARAGGETGLVAEILQAESARRGERFPHWTVQATSADWTRLGVAYLSRIEPAKGDAALITDKTLTNWQTLGAIRRMLPGAHIVHCLRDPLETAWSCYKHNFASDQLYSYEFAELAAFFAESLRAMAVWSERYPGWIRRHRHEELLANPEAATRDLLAACGLPFDPASLRFHEVEREVRTASAAQVRSPLRSDAAIAARYGALLDPLRAVLAVRGILEPPPHVAH
jgi:tetratricopeptide (TPR) repeat protein